jgi:hypothetical protein
VHKLLKSTSAKRDNHDASTYEFVGSLCPAGKSNAELDYVGCQTDAALVVDPAFNEKRSLIWEEAVEGTVVEMETRPRPPQLAQTRPPRPRPQPQPPILSATLETALRPQ